MAGKSSVWFMPDLEYEWFFFEGNQGGERDEEYQSMPSDCIVEICAIVTVKIAVYSPVGTIIALLDKIDMYFPGP